jgi:hypothetical protein
VLVNLITFMMIAQLLVFGGMATYYGISSLAGLVEDSRRFRAPPIGWLSQHLGLVCAVFGFGLGAPRLIPVGVLLIALGYCFARRASSDLQAIVDDVLIVATAISFFSLGVLHVSAQFLA